MCIMFSKIGLSFNCEITNLIRSKLIFYSDSNLVTRKFVNLNLVNLSECLVVNLATLGPVVVHIGQGIIPSCLQASIYLVGKWLKYSVTVVFPRKFLLALTACY